MRRFTVKAAINLAIVCLFSLLSGTVSAQPGRYTSHEENSNSEISSSPNAGIPDLQHNHPGILNTLTRREETISTCPDSNLYEMTLPFNETWGDPGGFLFYDWTFCPSQGSWVVSNVTGNQPPSADFQGATASTIEDYSFELVSLPLLA